MKSKLIALLALCLLTPAALFADDADVAAEKRAARDWSSETRDWNELSWKEQEAWRSDADRSANEKFEAIEQDRLRRQEEQNREGDTREAPFYPYFGFGLGFGSTFREEDKDRASLQAFAIELKIGNRLYTETNETTAFFLQGEFNIQLTGFGFRDDLEFNGDSGGGVGLGFAGELVGGFEFGGAFIGFGYRGKALIGSASPRGSNDPIGLGISGAFVDLGFHDGHNGTDNGTGFRLRLYPMAEINFTGHKERAVGAALRFRDTDDRDGKFGVRGSLVYELGVLYGTDDATAVHVWLGITLLIH